MAKRHATPPAWRSISRRSLIGGAIAATGIGIAEQAGLFGNDPFGAIPRVFGQAAPTTKQPDVRFPIPGYGLVETSSLTLYDVDGDGKLEIIGGTTRRNQQNSPMTFDKKAGVFIARPDGTLMQVVEPQGGGPVQGSVALGRLFGPSGDLYLVIPVGADVSDFRFNGGIQAWRFNGGTKRFEFAFEFRTRDDLMGGSRDGFSDPVFSAPCLADVDGDGILEVFFGGFDRFIYLIKPTPQGFIKLWDYNNADTIWSSGAAADVDGDGFLELIIGADITGENGLNGGYLLCFDRNGKRLWRNGYPEALYSSPAIGDVDGDGQLEVVVGTSDSWGWSERGGTIANQQFLGNFVVCVNAATGAEKWRFTTNGHGWSSPALGNFLNKTNPTTGFPTLQIVATSVRYETPDTPNNPSEAYLIDGDGKEVWRRRPKNDSNATAALRASPVVADINGDGKLEAIIPVIWDLAVFDAAGNQIELYHSFYTAGSSPVIGDVDGDGILEMFLANSNALPLNGRPQNDTAWVWGWKLARSTGLLPWPMFRKASDRNGVLLTQPFKRVQSLRVVIEGGTFTFPISAWCDLPNIGYQIDVVEEARYGLGSRVIIPGSGKAPDYLKVTTTAQTLPLDIAPVGRVDVDASKFPADGVYVVRLIFKPANPRVSLNPAEILVSIVSARHHIALPGAPSKLSIG